MFTWLFADNTLKKENHRKPVIEDTFAAMPKCQLADIDVKDTDTQTPDRMRLVFLASCKGTSRSTDDDFRGLASALTCLCHSHI